MSDFSKLDTLLHKTHMKVLRLNMCRSIISLSKITHQMWRDQKEQWGWWLEATGKGGRRDER